MIRRLYLELHKALQLPSMDTVHISLLSFTQNTSHSATHDTPIRQSLAMKAHGHKVVLVYASHRQILLPSTFQLLHHVSRYDAILKAFLDSAYRAMRHEMDAATQSAPDYKSSTFVLPTSFEQLAEVASAKDLRSYPLSLTTLAQIGVVLASRRDFREAMQGDVAAIWDPESSLTMAILRSVDVSSSLDLISEAIEAIKLACWVDFHLLTGSPQRIGSGLQRVTLLESEETLAAIAEKHGLDDTRIEKTMGGTVFEITRGTELETLVSDYDGKQRSTTLAAERSLIPALSSSEWAPLVTTLRRRLCERQISVALLDDLQGQQRCYVNGSISFGLFSLVSSLDYGRSQRHFECMVDLLQEQLAASRVYTRRIELLLLGGTMRDKCAQSAASRLASLKIPYGPVKLLHLLYPKDSHRLGDEPVTSSKVQGNPCQQIAIIGMSCRVPGANDAEELWQLLKDGKSMCEEASQELKHLPCIYLCVVDS